MPVRCLREHSLTLDKETVDGSIHCKPGGGELLVQEVYSILIPGASDTSRRHSQTSPTPSTSSLYRCTASEASESHPRSPARRGRLEASGAGACSTRLQTGSRPPTPRPHPALLDGRSVCSTMQPHS
ncbi:spermatogenesis-associated protein 4 isoform 1-T1 [Spinachia spinachia]